MPAISYVETKDEFLIALASAKHIVVTGMLTIGTDLELPTDVTVEVVRGGGFVIEDGVALVLHARLVAGPYPIFWGVPQGVPRVDWILPEWFKINPDADFRPALATCNDAFTTVSPRRLRVGADIFVSGTVSLENWDEIDAPGTIWMEAGELRLSHVVTQTVPVRWNLREIWRPGHQPEVVVLVVQNLKNAEVTVGSTSGVCLLAHAKDESSAVAYSRFNWGEVQVLRLVTVKEGAAIPWINENLHLGGRFRKIYIGGAYDSNNNMFVKPCVEGGEIRIARGVRNIFREVRTEGAAKIVFEADAHHNEVHELEQWPGVAVVEDAGRGNVVVRPDQRELERVVLCTLTSESSMTESAALGQLCRDSTWGEEEQIIDHGVPEVPALALAPDSLVPGVSHFGVTAYRQIVDTGLIPIERAVEFLVASEAETAWMRVAVRVYDASKTLLTPNFALPGVMLNGGNWRTHYAGVQKNCFHHQANVLGDSFFVQAGLVRYVRITVITGNITGVLPVRSFSISALVDRSRGVSSGDRGVYPALRELQRRFTRPLLVPGMDAPGAGWFEVGDRCHRADGGGAWRCVLSRKFEGVWNGTAIDVKLGALAGLAVDDRIGLEMDDGLMFWTKISAIAAPLISLMGNPGLVESAVRRMVHVVRWSQE